MNATTPRTLLAGAIVLVLSTLGGCDESPSPREDAASTRAAEPDARLQTHEIVPSTPTAQGLRYIQSVASIHREADDLRGDDQVALLEQGLELAVPDGLPEAEVLRLELASRIAAIWLEDGAAQRAETAKDLLAPMLEPSRSVPLDRASAEALVLLGDAATRTGDDALAAGTYARSIRMMSILRQELER